MILLLFILIPIFIIILLVLFVPIRNNNYYYASKKQYEDLLNLKKKYEVVKSKQLYDFFYKLKDMTFTVISDSYMDNDISVIDKIKIGRILKKISKMHLDITLMNVNKG